MRIRRPGRRPLLAVAAVVAACVGAGDAPGRDAGPRQIICATFWRDCSTAMRIVDCETGGSFNRKATNWRDVHSDGSRGSFGWFQVGAIHRRPGESVGAFAERMYVPRANVRLAYRLYLASGWRPWAGCL